MVTFAAPNEVDDIAAVIKAEHVAFWMQDHDGYERCHLHASHTWWWSYWRHGGLATVALTNETRPDFQRLPEADRADMDYFVSQVVVLLPVLGFDLFRRAVAFASEPEGEAGAVTFTFSTAGASATARETDEGFLVLAGSTARRTPSSTFPAGYAALREQLLSQGKLVPDASADLYRFAADVAFSSPSAAASIAAARSASGPLEWKLVGTGQNYGSGGRSGYERSPGTRSRRYSG